jgi:IS1 family transposase
MNSELLPTAKATNSVWLALDAGTREIVGVYIGARDEAAAQKLWKSLWGLSTMCRRLH